MKIAYFSPFPPERSGISEYSELLLPELRRRLDVKVVRRGATKPPRGVDLCVYHIGNNPEGHGWIATALRRNPGLVVLHEYVLHHLVAGMTLGHGDAEGYLLAMQREAGVQGRLLAHAVVDGLISPLWETRPLEFPLTSFVLDDALGLVVHSEFVAGQARRAGYQGPIRRIPMPAWDSSAVESARLPEGRRPVIGCFGHLNETKRVPQVLTAFRRLREELPEALLVLAGGTGEGFDLAAAARDAGVVEGDDYFYESYVTEGRLWALVGASDVCVTLRSPTMGETSGMVVRALSLGKPTVVSDVGWFSELPDGVVAKVPVDDREADVLRRVLQAITADPRLAAGMAATGRAYAKREHDLGRAAELYEAAIEEAAGGAPARAAPLRDTAEAAFDVGIDRNSPLLADIRKRFDEVGLG